MIKAKDVFEIAMSLIDERLESGQIDPSSTIIFKKNAPYILTSLQDELIEYSDYYKEKEIIKSSTSNEGGYEKYVMDDDFQDARQIIEITSDGIRNLIDYKWLGKNELYIPDSFVGTVKIKYYPIPDAITDLEDILVLDAITCRTTLANGLASRLLTNENKVLANYFNDIYNELKFRKRRRKLATTEPIRDYYNSNNSY